MGRRSDDEVFRITGARSSLTEDVRGRQRRYVISMLIRTVCVLLAVVLWNVERYLAFAALAGGVLLPYIAVVIANAGRERSPGLPSTFDVPPTTPLMLGPGGKGGSGASESPTTEDL
jgi:small neutral amino acid transporter SnatA (MarC family)